MALLEGLEDWAVKKVVDDVLAGYIQRGELMACEEPVIDRAAIDITNALLAEFAKSKAVQSS
jgi:hypothetical protein